MICAGSIEKIASFEERTVEACSAFASSPCLRSVMSTIRPIERVARRPSAPSAKKVLPRSRIQPVEPSNRVMRCSSS